MWGVPPDDEPTVQMRNKDKVEAYITSNKVHETFQGLFTELIVHMPDDPLEYLEYSLKNKLHVAPSMPRKQRRCTVLRNGERKGGFIAPLTPDFNTFLHKISAQLGFECRRVFNSQGAEVNDTALIDPDEVVYASNGAAFRDPFSPVVASMEQQCDNDFPTPEVEEVLPESPATVATAVDAALPAAAGYLTSAELDKLVSLATGTKLNTIHTSILFDVFNHSSLKFETGLTEDGVNDLLMLVTNDPRVSAGFTEDERNFLTRGFVPQMYELYDHDRSNGFIEFNELAGGLAVVFGGDRLAKMKLIYSILDIDDNGCCNRLDLSKAIIAMIKLIFNFSGREWTQEALSDARLLAQQAFPDEQQLSFDQLAAVVAEHKEPLTGLLEAIEAAGKSEAAIPLAEATTAAPAAATTPPPTVTASASTLPAAASLAAL
eukprot:gnl/Spiro4/24664_TR12237_c0_g1_i1.p1 gnl/Spiro4/24664_TR12237_c0_g1~~gnl/Spiro4/24664_TR12237_c0_g1_i1.p1  ORF type:complete len:432 (+),score=115.20 gnl/Spiro4/24664_TR12237_c0_g1_i1:62-1357(+)